MDGKHETLCPVARSQEIVGDRWTVVILREMFSGNRRFDQLLAQTEATPQMLTTRLKRLEADEMIERRVYNIRPLRHEYVLTEKGRSFYPVILALRAWGEVWCKSRKDGIAVRYTHKTCGKDAGLGTTCKSCGEALLRREELEGRMSPAYARERKSRGPGAERPASLEQ